MLHEQNNGEFHLLCVFFARKDIEHRLVADAAGAPGGFDAVEVAGVGSQGGGVATEFMAELL
jgi:hypothetical protein